MNLKLKISAATLLISCASFSQLDLMNKERNKVYSIIYSDSIIDPTYGITQYEKYNILIADSTRYCGRNPCYGIVKDYYKTDTLLHRGKYSEGKLQGYRNYYPTGVLEREIRFVNIYTSKPKLYYPSGNIKSEILYYNSNPIKWVDYFDNGKIEYEEHYNKKYSILIKEVSYFHSGQIEEEKLLIKKSKSIYSFKTFYNNGQIKSEGEMRYLKNLKDYRKTGTWLNYNPKGVLTKEEKLNY